MCKFVYLLRLLVFNTLPLTMKWGLQNNVGLYYSEKMCRSGTVDENWLLINIPSYNNYHFYFENIVTYNRVHSK